MKDHALKAAIVGALVVLAFVLRGRDANLPQTPEAAVEAFFDAARNGDVERYLALTAGQMRASLETTRKQLGAEAFRKNVIQSVAGVTGIAKSTGSGAPADALAIDVELVFVDRNEKQQFVLAQQRGGWVIESVTEATVAKPLIPYGTPVFGE